jgi:HEAT repeat protein
MIDLPHPPPGASSGPYGLPRPDLDEAHQALAEVYAEITDRIWVQLLETADLTGRETDPEALDRVIEAMKDCDPITALCARSLAIRVASFDAITTDRELIGSTA